MSEPPAPPAALPRTVTAREDCVKSPVPWEGQRKPEGDSPALLQGRGALRKARYGHGETQFLKVKSFKTSNTNIQYASLTFIHPHPHTQFSDLICQLQIKFKTGFKFKTKFHDWFQTYQTISMQIAGKHLKACCSLISPVGNSQPTKRESFFGVVAHEVTHLATSSKPGTQFRPLQHERAVGQPGRQW